MSKLKEQLEKIIDEGTGKRRNVIVQMESPEPTDQRLFKLAADVYQRRNLSYTARDLLPAPRQQLEKLQQPLGNRRAASPGVTLSTSSASLADSFASEQSTARMELGVAALAPLLASELFQKVTAEMMGASAKTTRGRKKTIPVSSPSFWSSQSAVLDISKDDLSQLPQAVPQIQNIYVNRVLRLPNLLEVKDLPLAVLENKASAWGINKIGALAAWGAYDAWGQGTKIAVLDTGVDPDHPDLAGKVTSWAEFDSNGIEVPGSKPHDSATHGTHCAGTIAGGNASGRWIGVAPEAEIAAALVLKAGVGTDAQILAGIEWAINQKVDVISMSLGGLMLDVEVPDPYTEALLSALLAGIPVVTAIGNDGNQTTGTPGNDLFAFSVGATDYLDRPAGFSGGRTHVLQESKYLDPQTLPLVYLKPEVSAPGVAIQSAIPGGEWAAYNGTSMATPHVAGAIALLLSATTIRETIPVADRAFLLQDLITGSVEELGEAGQDHRYGFGRIDVLRAIGFAKEKRY
jgi:subtilisin family serine protease